MTADMTITLDISGFNRFMQQYPTKVDRALDGAAEQITGDIVQSFGTGPGGAVYGNHTASQPGYPPNVDTGTLRASMHWQRGNGFERFIRDGVDYGEPLELGIGMGARPFVAPAMRRFGKRAEAYFAGVMNA